MNTAKGKARRPAEGSKSPKRVVTTPKGKKDLKSSAKKPMSMAKARREHKTIPGVSYKPKEQASQKANAHPSQIIQKNTYGPLGRPPEDPVARAKYAKAHSKLTTKGKARESKRKLNQEVAYRRSLASYKKEKAKESYIDIRQVKEDLEDWGYSDINPHWRRMGKAGLIQAWEDMQQEHLSRR